MAEKSCIGTPGAPGGCPADRRLRLQALADAPMTRVEGSREAACPLPPAPPPPCPCWEELLAALEEQRKLLYDLLGAVSALTAAQLAIRQQGQQRQDEQGQHQEQQQEQQQEQEQR